MGIPRVIKSVTSIQDNWNHFKHLYVNYIKHLPSSKTMLHEKANTLISLHVCVFILILASNVEVLMSKTETCYSLVCQTVEEFSESEAIQEVGCCLLRKFTSGGEKNHVHST